MLPLPLRWRRLVYVASALALLFILWSLVPPQYSLYGPTIALTRPCRKNNFQYVNPLIGSVGGGHVFAGATLPFGMAKASADVTGENQGGFGSDGSDVMGFSGLHDLGVGWRPSLGNFPIMPIIQCEEDNPNLCTFHRTGRPVGYRSDSVVAHPGYFGLTLENGIMADMTVTHHTVIYRFRLDKARVSMEFGSLFYMGLEDLTGASLDRLISVDQNASRIKGHASFRPSFGNGKYHAHFCADFHGSSPLAAGYNSAMQNLAPLQPLPQSSNTSNGAWLQFERSSEVLVRVGMSFISDEQACANGQAEIPKFDFEDTLVAAEQAWEEKFAVMGIDQSGASHEMQTIFWTGVYRSFISPQDYTGENQLWKSTEPYFDSWYCIWDTFRTTHPLLTMLDPPTQTLMVRSLIDIYVHEGKLPDCRMSFSPGFTQGGSNADVVLTDSYLKGISDDIDWLLGLNATLADANEYSPNWLVGGRGGIDDWHNLGYLSVDNSSGYSRSISRTVEYGYNDFCIAELAHKLDQNISIEMLERSHNWENLWNPETKSYLPGPEKGIQGPDTGFTGFLQPRQMNGEFKFQDPAICSPLLEPNGCFFDRTTKGETYEGSVWLYTFLASPSNMATLIEKLGGDRTFIRRLDYFHESGLLYFGDEQSFLTAYLYHYAGRPALSGERVRSYIPSQFNTSLNGLPGNDDSGAMGAFTVLSMMGLFPSAGQDVYFIVPPFFRHISILNKSTGKTATIEAVNFDGSHGNNRFIQSVRLNGRPWSRSWLRHRFFLDGGTLEVVLGPKESSWGSGLTARPPSTGRNGSWNFMYI